MSDALNYLIAARPDAIVPYFKFLKEAGKNLDIRTRDLISVITKVDAQTEAGFRQYLSRALRNGASPNEVLDALLMARESVRRTLLAYGGHTGRTAFRRDQLPVL
jgi:DNA-directed RNA polymerase subunit N (RpoN/RPB10)